MTKRLRHLLAGLSAIAAVAATSFALAAPAQADPSTGCTSISVNGSITPSATPEGTYGLKLDVDGHAADNCGRGAAYRYLVTVNSSATGEITVISESASARFNGTYIGFPTATFDAPTGKGNLTLSIRTQTKPLFMNYWTNTGSVQNYVIGVPAPDFDTAGMSQGMVTSCSTGGPIVGNKGWC